MSLGAHSKALRQPREIERNHSVRTTVAAVT